jgi:FdhD protein
MHPIVRITNGQIERADDALAPEEPLEIRVRGRAISITMRSPGNDGELAAGFLLTEGVIASAADVARIEPCDRVEGGNVINVVLAPQLAIDFDKLTRHVFAASSCGICGKTTIESIHARFEPIKSDAKVNASVIARLPEMMRAAQPMFDRSGGLHAAAVFDLAGNLLLAREDVGRHNAVDKVVGRALLDDKLPLDRHVLLVSGRASFEIMQKSLAARVAIVAAVSAPSDLAVDFARESGQTLIGFVRDRPSPRFRRKSARTPRARSVAAAARIAAIALTRIASTRETSATAKTSATRPAPAKGKKQIRAGGKARRGGGKKQKGTYDQPLSR